MKKRGLGRNLNVLLSRTNITVPAVNQTVSASSITTASNSNNSEQPITSDTVDGLRYLPVELLQRGRYQHVVILCRKLCKN